MNTDSILPMTPCVVWTGARTEKGAGYGLRTVGGKRWVAHRYAYFQKHGLIPDGLLVCHRCNNKPCVNTDHLYLATNQQNILDAFRDGLIVTNNNKKKVCSKCGGPYSLNALGKRICKPCRNASTRKSKAATRAKLLVARSAKGTEGKT